MKEINIAESDISAIATQLKRISSDVSSPTGPEWSYPPAVKVIDCVLSLNRKYDTFVIPRLKTFMSNHPEIQRVVELAKLMDHYPTPHAFVQQEINYNHEDRARILDSVVKYFCTILAAAKTLEQEKEKLTQWAIESKPHGYQTLRIKGFGIAGFQYLRMLFGADTTKPDVHIIRFLSDILNRRVSDIESLLLLEAASKREDLSVRAVDSYIWKRGARGQQDRTETNTVRLAPDVAADFPTEKSVDEALRSILKELKERSKKE